MENSTAASYGNFVSAREPEFSTPSVDWDSDMAASHSWQESSPSTGNGCRPRLVVASKDGRGSDRGPRSTRT